MLLKGHRVEEKQSLKLVSVDISTKYRKLQRIKKMIYSLDFFAQIAFLVDSFIHFICTRYFYPSAEYPFFFRDISWLSSNSSVKVSRSVVKGSKKIYLIRFDFILSVLRFSK